MGTALGLDDADAATLLQIEMEQVRAAADAALAAARRARASSDEEAISRLRAELLQRRDRITQLVYAISRG
jgi:hypothetical protein